MPKKIIKSAAWDIAAILPFFCLCSCIVDSYEWDDIDTSINIQTDVGFPVGNSEPITIASLLSLDSSMLYMDSDGYFHFRYNSDPISETISISSFSLDGGKFIEDVEFNLTPINLKYKIAEANNYLLDNYLTFDLSQIKLEGLDSLEVTDLIEGGSVSDTFSIEEEVSELAEHIEEISYIYLNAPVTAYVSMEVKYETKNDVDRDEVSLATSGFKITFPKYMDISVDSDYLKFDEASHSIQLNKSVSFSSTNPMEVSFTLDGINMLALKEESQGDLGYVEYAGTRYIKIDGEVEVSDLVLKFKPDDYGESLADVPDVLDFSIDLEFDEFSVNGADVRMCSEMEIEDMNFELGGLFDFLESDNAVIDLYNPVIFLNIANSTPMAASFSSKLKSYADNYDKEVVIGSNESPIIFRSFDDASTCTSTIYFSSKAVDMSSSDSDYNENIIIEELSDILSNVPDEVSISDILVSAYYENETDFSRIKFPDDPNESLDYGFEFSYGFNIPLAFGENLSISYSYDIAGLWELFGSEYENSEVYVNVATLKMTFENTVPLQMNLTASALGTDGKLLNDESIEIELSSIDGGEAIVMGGTVDSPQESIILLTLSAGGQVLEDLDGFRLNITAGTSEELAGTQLNFEQYIQIKDITLHFDGGIDIEF